MFSDDVEGDIQMSESFNNHVPEYVTTTVATEASFSIVAGTSNGEGNISCLDSALQKEIYNAKIGIPNDFLAGDRYLLDLLAAKDANQILYLVYRKHYIILQTRSGKDVAVLDTRTTKALKTLSDLKSVRFEAFPIADGLANGVQVWKEKGKITGISVEINVYGGRDVVNVVGKNLSRSAIYLQHPGHLGDNIEYHNPHYLTLPGQLRLEHCTLTPPYCPGEPTKGTSGPDIATVFDSLKRYRCLQQVDVDLQVRTSLLSHQKEGVHFMAQREGGEPFSDFNLWKADYRDGQYLYRHAIVGSTQCIQPLEAGGGILADDMGLGKTLTVLATIVRSMDRAREFVAFQQGGTSNGVNGTRISAKSTLVLAPSTRRLTDPAKFLDYDIVLTTYATAASEFSKDNSVLHNINWFRIVLDEDSVCLRRTKHLLNIPAPLDKLRKLYLSPAEQQHYTTVCGELRTAIDDAVSSKDTTKTCHGILQAILRLRLLCNHGTFERRSSLVLDGSLPSDPDEAFTLLQQSEETTCSYCSYEAIPPAGMEGPSSYHLTVCSHLLCPECLPQYENGLKGLGRGRGYQCPICQQSIGLNYLATTQKRQDHFMTDAKASPRSLPSNFQPHGYSSKINALVEDLERIPDGTKSRIFILEPQWNPAVENQAIGRVLRLGQTRPVTVVRYVVHDTIEESVRSRQSKKLQLAEFTWDQEEGEQKDEKLRRLMVRKLHAKQFYI
ncbi:hypothetical protein FGG08_007035 [Glutinoglossum americanum]|uniref:RING-type domain-containing protein n=1 Tax=Glutinoglossum americanum TaxID=1670608 RepID=A0A9P8HV22_9PEZI|nr:hypothetical protein FGG08_007035 [Glutinoglossum americanum]